MDPKFRSSFIPKKPLPVKSAGKVKQHHSFNLIVFLAVILFIAALGLTGAAFWYKAVLTDEVNEKGIALSKEKDNLQIDRIDEYRLLANRMNAANNLLVTHNALSKFFRFLNQKTLHGVAYSSFSFQEAAGSLEIQLSGEAESFNALTVQSDVFKRENILTNIRISEISLEEDGVVKFGLAAELVPDEVRYTP